MSLSCVRVFVLGLAFVVTGRAAVCDDLFPDKNLEAVVRQYVFEKRNKPDPLVEAATELGLPIYIHSGTPVFSLPLQIIELAERHPASTLIMGHMGGADFYVDVPSSAHRAANVYYETSLTCHIGYVDEIVLQAGHERVLFGSDSPTSQQAAELLKIRLAILTDAQRQDVLGNNVLRLLGEKG